ncbi:MAG: glycosyltransferase, partial [Rhabdochlamydiaceae bacterium]
MQVVKQASRFAIGICATGSCENLSSLLTRVESEKFPDDFVLDQIIIVASGCDGNTLDEARSFSEKDDRVLLIEESQRYGKADAINKIINISKYEDYLVLINSDALPLRDSISKLLLAIQDCKTIGLVSGNPFFEGKLNNPTSMVEELMWKIHNECSLRLNHMNVSNHGNDEMMVARREVLDELPTGLVNDGAYIGGRAKRNGYSVKFCENANVLVDVPKKTSDLIGQRRRIIFGHFQVWRLTGESPKTIESLLLSSPAISLNIIARVLARYPRLIPIV